MQGASNSSVAILKRPVGANEFLLRILDDRAGQSATKTLNEISNDFSVYHVPPENSSLHCQRTLGQASGPILAQLLTSRSAVETKPECGYTLCGYSERQSVELPTAGFNLKTKYHFTFGRRGDENGP
jgi:hypothetical protein